jgi:helicase
MKHLLPENHGLSATAVEMLVFREDGTPALTNAQYSALDAGVARGTSTLILSPTATGKTQIAIWAIARALESNARAIYLVTHRALAAQKFDDFRSLLRDPYLNDDASQIVLATGDAVLDGNDEQRSDPLNAALLVATYEKYLAILSAHGVPSSLENAVFVCDEIQLIGDQHRGQNVEVLLTLLRNAGWKQFVGLSAVLDPKDAADLSTWLNVTLVREPEREKTLVYEYWSQSGVVAVNTDSPEQIEKRPLPITETPNVMSVLSHLSKQASAPFPVIVFCMRKQDVFDLATAYLQEHIAPATGQLSLDLDLLPETKANSFLANAVAHRIAIHSADLTDEERALVERALLERRIDFVYATSTLAAGVNFPLGAAVFNAWTRWDRNQRAHVPIAASEFHNMAGRVGRMGTDHAVGRVIFLPDQRAPASAYKQYLNLKDLPLLEPRISSETFDQMCLPLVAAGLCRSTNELEALILTSFSGMREKDRNLSHVQQWPDLIRQAVQRLSEAGMLLALSDEQLVATPVRKAVGQSGLKPASGVVALNYLIRKGETLSDLLNERGETPELNRFAFLIFAACFSLPEFRPCGGVQPSRFVPWPLDDLRFDASHYASDLLKPSWFADVIPTNAADLALRWINGERLAKLEKTHSNLSAGMLREMYRNLGWALQGVAQVVSAAADTRIPDQLRPAGLQGNDKLLRSLRKLPRSMTRLNFRVALGLPDIVLWMQALNRQGDEFRLSRDEILDFYERSWCTPETIMLGSHEADEVRVDVFARTRPSPQAKANWLRDRTRAWKADERKRAAERQHHLTNDCFPRNLLDDYYATRGEQFEHVFEQILSLTQITFERLDNGSRVGAPDYLIKLKGSPPLIFELKSKQGEKLVDFNSATEVLSASEIHGHKDAFCVTLCHPGVDPSVPIAIIGSGRLCIVESADLAEALLRLCNGQINEEQLWQWLTTPGQALRQDLPYLAPLRPTPAMV